MTSVLTPIRATDDPRRRVEFHLTVPSEDIGAVYESLAPPLPQF
jgi:hypothetical protein